MAEEVQRDLGKHEAQIEALERDVRDLRDEIAAMRKEQRDEIAAMRSEFSTALAAINTTLSEAKGGWRVLMMVAGGSAVLGGAVAKVVTWLNWLPR